MPINEPTGWMSYLQFTKDDIMRVAEQGVMALLGLVVLLLVVRPLVRRIVTPDGGAMRRTAARGASAAGTAGVAGAIGLPQCHRHRACRPASRQSPARRRRQYLHRRRRRIGRHLQPHLGDDRHRPGAGTGARPVGAESRRARRENPHEAVSIIRNWLHEDAA